MNDLDCDGTKAERYFEVLGGATLAEHITMLYGEDVDFFAIGSFFVLNAMVLSEPSINWKNPSCRGEQGSHLAAWNTHGQKLIPTSE